MYFFDYDMGWLLGWWLSGQMTHASSDGLKVWKNTKDSILEKLGWTTIHIFEQWNSRLKVGMQENSMNFIRTKMG